MPAESWTNRVRSRRICRRYRWLTERNTESTLPRAQALFAKSPLRLPPLTVKGEERSLVIGKIGSNYWTAVVTIRLGVIRLISCRRSRDSERTLYDQEA